MNKAITRLIQKYSKTTGVVPTVPVSNDHTDGTWLNTDIYEGELFLNTADLKLYTREGNTIILLGSISIYNLNDLGDVDTTGVGDNYQLYYDEYTEMWLAMSPLFLEGAGTGSVLQNNGTSNLADGVYAIAMGNGSEALADNSIALGETNSISSAGLNSSAIGKSNQISAGSCSAVGESNIISANNSHAVGFSNNISSDGASAAVGNTNIITGNVCHAVGEANEISGEHNNAFGRANVLQGENAYSIGVANYNEGTMSITLGADNKGIANNTIAKGTSSYADVAYAEMFSSTLWDVGYYSQSGKLMMQKNTTDNTTVNIESPATDAINIRANHTYMFYIKPIVRRQSDGVCATIPNGVITCLVNDVNGTTSGSFAPVTFSVGNAAFAACTIEGNISGNSFQIRVTGNSGELLYWTALVEWVETGIAPS